MDERVDLLSLNVASRAKQFYIDEIQKPSNAENKAITLGGMLQKFKDRFPSETKRERMSPFLQSVQIHAFERHEAYSPQALEKLIAEINKKALMT